MLITADFETYYSQTYSLSKISTEAYIRSPEFEVIGVSIKIDDGPTQWYPQPQVGAALRAIDWSRAFLLAQNCVTGDHEVRTKAGWVRLDALPDGEPVLQWDPATTELSYCVPTVVRKAYDGPMLEWSTSFHRGIYTPDHRMYIQTPHVTNWQAKPASTVAALGQNNTYIPTGGQLLAGDLLDITPLEARILEFLRADGYLPANGRHATARFSKARKISRVRALLDAWGCKYAVREEPHGSKSTTFVYVHPSERLDVLRQLLGVGTSKALGPWVLSLSLPARRALLDETQYWDGYRGRGSRGNASSKQAVVVHSAKRDDIYWLTELAVLSGMSAVARYDVPNTRGWSRPDSVLHHVRIRDRERVKLVTGPTERKFSGTVYCLQVPTKAFLVRREGITWVTGNCAFDGAILTWRYGIQPKGLLDTMGMSRALFPHEKSHSLAAQAKRAGIGVKGEEVVHAIGKRYADFDEQALARYGAYCCNDVELTYALFKQYMAMGFPAQELKLIDLTLRMYTEPVLRLDGELLVQHLQEVRARKGELLATLRDHLIASGDADAVATIFTEGVEGLKKHLMSNEKFAALLRSMGVEPPTKISPTTGKEAYAFAKSDEAFLALAEDLDVRVQALVAARLGNKSTLEETRTERFIEMASRGAFAVPLRYYGAHSGRWSGQDGVNLQNLPARDPKGKALKNSILPPVGHVFLDCDSAQIESRTLAWLAGQDDLVEAYRSKADVYKRMASVIYGKPVDEISKVERQVGKVVVLSCGYGVGHKKLQRFLKVQAGVEVSEAEAKRIVDTYRAANGRIVDLWRRSDAALGHLAGGAAFTVDIPGIIRVEPGKGLTLPSGLHIQYPNLRRIVTEEGKAAWVYESKGEQVYVYGGKVVENYTQAVARCVVAEQMLRISRRYKVVLTVHDSVGCVAPAGEAEQAQAYVEECMRWVPAWANGLPLSCESGVGASYGAC